MKKLTEAEHIAVRQACRGGYKKWIIFKFNAQKQAVTFLSVSSLMSKHIKC